MKISLNVEADGINVLALNMGKIAVEVDGVDIKELLNVVNDNGYTLRIADVPGPITVENPLPPTTRLAGIQCSTAHITSEDNACLGLIQGSGNDCWIHDTGYGYLLRLNASAFPVLRLKRLGLSKACRRLVVTLIRRYHINMLHLDADGDFLSGFETFDW